MIRLMNMIHLLIRLILSIRLREIVINEPGDLKRRYIEIDFGSMRFRIDNDLGIEIENIHSVCIKAPIIFLETNNNDHWQDVIRFKEGPNEWDEYIESTVLEAADEALCEVGR